MEQLRFIVISVTLLLCTANAFAQRHYENISALEINYGTNIFGDADNYTSLSFLEKPLNFDPFGHARFAHLFVLYD